MGFTVWAKSLRLLEILLIIYEGPHNNGTNFAEYCPPTTECQMLRFFGGKCEAQGYYEPVICPPGYYCPKGGHKKIQCPAGNFCPEGSVKPWPCEIGTICESGSENRFDIAGLVFIIIIIDIALIAATGGVSLWRRLRNRGLKRSGDSAVRVSAMSTSTDKKFTTDDTTSFVGTSLEHGMSLPLKATPPATPEIPDVEPEDEFDPGHDVQLLVQSYEKMIDGKHLGLGFDFQNLALKLKSGKELLFGVSGTIERGSMWGVMGPSGAGKGT